MMNLTVRTFFASLFIFLATSTTLSSAFASPPVGSVTAIIAVGPGPRGMAFNPNNGYLYVANSSANTVSVINGATNTVIGSPIAVGAYPLDIAFNPNNGYLYVANHFSGSVSVINGATNTVIATIGGMAYVNSLTFNSANGNIYVADDYNNGGGAINVISGLTRVATIPVAFGPGSGITFNPVNGYIYAPAFNQNSLTVINGATNSVIASIPVGFAQAGAVFNPSNGYIYVYGGYPGVMLAIDPATNSTVASIPLGTMTPTAAAYNADNQIIYVGTINLNSATAIDTSTNTVVGSISLGASLGAAYNPLNRSIYVSNYYDGTVTVISAPADTTAPVVTVPGNISAEATGPSGRMVAYTASATDSVDGTLAATCAPASGSTFAIGTSPVTCSATDAAGNTGSASFSVTVRDTTPPTIAAQASFTVEATSAAGAMVSYISPSTADAVDGAGSATCLPASGSTFALGNNVVTCTATDAHGNAATATTFVMHVADTVPPVIGVSQFPLANGNGWNNSNVTVSFAATDAVSTPACSVNTATLTANGAGQVVSTTCTDAAGNSASASHTVNLDKTAPVVSGTRTPAANGYGWNNADVTVHFTATDGLSGVAGSASTTVVLSSEGAGQSASRSFTDLAGNTGSATVSNINIDKSAPLLAMPSLAGSYGVNSSLTLSFAATDTLSDIATRSATLNGNPVSNGSTVLLAQLGANTFTLTATDKAGNSVTQTRQFNVNYTFGGFLSPLAARTTFHLGSVIPVKFDLFDANGVAISSAVAHLSLQQYSGGDPVGDPIDATPTGGADSGNLFRYNGGHYMYNLSTKPLSPGVWRILAILNDGTVRSVEIGLTSK